MMLADGELSPEESRTAERHLAGCRPCSDLLEGLRAESRCLAKTVMETAGGPADLRISAVRPAHAACAALIAGVAAIGVQMSQSLISGTEPPPGIAWLNPVNLKVLLGTILDGLFYITREGGTMLQSSITTAAITGLGLSLLTLASMWILGRRRLAPVTVSAVLIAFLAFPAQASAVEVRDGDKVTIAADEVVDDTLILLGQHVSVEGTVTGDLIAFAEIVDVSGTVEGSTYVFCKKMTTGGEVKGNVHTFAQEILLEGRLHRNGFLFGQIVSLAEGGRIDGDGYFFCQANKLSGEVGRDAVTFSESARIAGKVGRNLSAFVGRRLRLTGDAQVGGDLSAHLERAESLSIDSGATILGKTTTSVSPPPAPAERTWSYVWEAAKLAGALLVGGLLFVFFPGIFGRRMDSAGSILGSMGVGFLALVATPVAAIILAATVIGLPLASIGAGLYILGLYLAKIVVAASIGQLIVSSRPGQSWRFACGLFAGLLILVIATHLPLVGGWIQFLVILLGLGAVVLQASRPRTRPEPEMI
jgi:cytoskeletal protein CcmA (bactofilin family)